MSEEQQNMGLAETDAAWLRGLTGDWDEKDARRELDECMATAKIVASRATRMKMRVSDIKQRKAPIPEHLSVSGMFMDLAEKRAYELENSKDPRDIRVGRAMAARLEVMF